MRGLALAFVVALVCRHSGARVGHRHEAPDRFEDLVAAGPAGRAEAARALAPRPGRRLHAADPRARGARWETSRSGFGRSSPISSLHQRRLDALNALFTLQSRRFSFLRQQYAKSVAHIEPAAGRHLRVCRPSSTLDVVPRCAASIQDALDQVQYLNDIGEQDRRIAAQVRYAKAAGHGCAREDEEAPCDACRARPR